jgi:hypothetical protein
METTNSPFILRYNNLEVVTDLDVDRLDNTDLEERFKPGGIDHQRISKLFGKELSFSFSVSSLNYDLNQAVLTADKIFSNHHRTN